MYNSRALPLNNKYTMYAIDKPTYLCRNIGCGKMQVLIQIMGMIPIDQLGYNLSIPRLIKLIHQHPMKLRQVFHHPYDNLQEMIEIGSRGKLVVDLRKDAEYIHSADASMPSFPSSLLPTTSGHFRCDTTEATHAFECPEWL